MSLLAILCEINVADSVQWLAYDSDKIVRGTVVESREGVWTIEIAEMLKGDKAERLTVPGKEAPAGEALFFLSKKGLREGASPAVVPLDGKHGVFDADFKEYLKKDDVLGAVRAAVKAMEKEKPKSTHVDAPFDSPAFKRLWSGSSVWITVPLDKAMRERALTWQASADRELRANAAKILK